MPVYLSHYVGPVLLAKQHPEKEVTWFRACSNTKCNLYRKQNRCQGKHCHDCGAEVKNYKGKPQLVRKPYSHEIQEAFTRNGLNPEALWLNDFAKLVDRDDFVVYMPNNYLNTVPPSKFHVEYAQNCTTLLCERDPQQEIVWFKDTYNTYIAILESLYDVVEIHWAVLNYQS